MRDLNATNPSIAHPSQLAFLLAFLPLVFGGGMLAFADGAAPQVPVADNPISIFSFAILIAALVLLICPHFFKWDWKARYFGIGLVSLSSISLIAFGPFVCAVLYGALPGTARVILSIVYLGTHFIWARRFVKFYKIIEQDPKLLAMLYQEDGDAIYYIQKADVYFFEKKLKLEQFPPGWLFVLCMIAGFSFVPFMTPMTHAVGLPFTHIFLIVAAFPISLLGFGILVRAWIIFFRLPIQLKRATGKETYVDMTAAVRRKP